MKWHPPLGNPMPPNSVLTVSELLRSVRDALERRFPLLWVRGELSNLSRAPSGHCYFTLKDAAAQVDCVMFRSRAAALDWEPRDGARVEVRALVTLYEPRGRFQLTVEGMRPAGLGPLYERFLRLKEKLEREGDRKSTRLNSSHSQISYAVFCLKKKNINREWSVSRPTSPTQNGS